MRATRILVICGFFLAAVSLASAQTLTTVYEHDFDTPVSWEWSKQTRTTTPNLVRTFLGRFGGEQVTLDLEALPEHCSVTISFDLLIIGSWEGSVGHNAGPDVWDLEAFSRDDCCPVENLITATFANCECKFQSYPENYPDVHHPGWTGADEIHTLGYDYDSVYYLSFTFFHDADDLTFSFSATPHLQRLDDESWGIDNLVVQVDADETYCCRATRELPVVYGGGQPVPVSLDVRLNPRAQAHVIEETPPTGWTVSNINDGGLYENSTGMIKWGPFFGTQARTLTYTATPPATATGDKTFSGEMYVDGVAEPICGDDTISPGSYHPSDLDTDWRIEPDEFTAYGAAWRKGDPWTSPPVPIPADYVTNAGMLWKLGERYVYAASAAPPWVSAKSDHLAAGTVEATLSTHTYTPGEPIQVTLRVIPAAGVTAYAVEDAPPAGWVVASVGNDGLFDNSAGKVKWGVFLDDTERTLSYSVIPAIDSGGTQAFDGIGSFDGASLPVSGHRVLSPPTFAGVDYLVPAAAHTPGNNSTEWRTDLSIHNRGLQQATYTITLLESGQDNTEAEAISFTLNAGMSVRYRDLLGSLFDYTGGGALLVTTSEEDVIISSRTYTQGPAGSFGQAIPGERLTDAVTTNTQVHLVQLSHSADRNRGFRTNAGFVNVAEVAITLNLDLYDRQGILLGTRTVDLEPLEYRQVGNIFALVTSEDVEDAFIIVRSETPNARYFAYASVVDNGSGDPFYVRAR